MRWLQIAALVVVALVLVRTVTSPRVLTSVAAPGDTDLSTAVTADGAAAADASAVDARPVRRARPLQPGLIPQLAIVLFAALSAVGAVTRRRSTDASPQLVSRSVPVLGGRAPPPALV